MDYHGKDHYFIEVGAGVGVRGEEWGVDVDSGVTKCSELTSSSVAQHIPGG